MGPSFKFETAYAVIDYDSTTFMCSLFMRPP
jgi:hypothetical protein